MLARQGRRMTREHQLPLALMALLLEQEQQAPVTEMLVVGGGGRRLERDRVGLSAGLRKQLGDALRKLRLDLQRLEPPDLAADRRKCTLCSWRQVCNDVASREGHLSEVSGIGAKRREMLQELNVHGLADLAAANPEQLATAMERFGEQHGDVARSLVAQARCQRSGLPERLSRKPALPELTSAPGVLLYDIESDPDARHDFLHGFWCLPRGRDGDWNPAAARISRCWCWRNTVSLAAGSGSLATSRVTTIGRCFITAKPNHWPCCGWRNGKASLRGIRSGYDGAWWMSMPESASTGVYLSAAMA